MKAVTLVVFKDRSVDLGAILSAASSIGRIVKDVYYDPDENVFSAIVSGADTDLFIVGEPSPDRAAALKNAFNGAIDCFFIKDRLVAVFLEVSAPAVSAVVSKIKSALDLEDRRVAFKLYGERGDRLRALIKEITDKNPDIDIFFTEKNCDILCDFLIKKGYSPERLDRSMKTFVTEFADTLYADEDVDLYERFLTVMKLYGRKLSVAESMTGGNIAASIVKFCGASEVLYEGLVTYDTRAKFRRLGVLPETVMTETVVSAKVAYEMVRPLVNENSSVAISITGYAPSVKKNKNDGLCFIGVAVDQKIKVFRYVFSGDRKTVIEKASGAAVFSALKLLTESFFVN